MKNLCERRAVLAGSGTTLDVTAKRAVWLGVSLDESKAAKRNVSGCGAILEKQVGHFNWTGECLHDMRSNLSTHPRATTELDSFQRLFCRPFQICPHVGGELDDLVHGIATFRDPAVALIPLV